MILRDKRDLTTEVMDSVMEGYHGTIFAYGQTGSGKTYTMVGDRAEGVPGVMSLGTKQIFDWIHGDKYRDYMVRCSYMEIYMERVRDLLNPAKVLKIMHFTPKVMHVTPKTMDFILKLMITLPRSGRSSRSIFH